MKSDFALDILRHCRFESCLFSSF